MIRFNTKNVRVYLAPAGAGKTKMLMDEMVELLHTYRPDEIAFVTFTRKGVENGIERALKANKNLTPEDLIHFTTLHAMCFHEAGIKHKNIIEARDIEHFNSLFGFNVHLADAFDNTTEDDKLLQRYDAVRAGCKRGTIVERAFDEERYTRLINAYEAFKVENELVDFYDCLTKFRDLGLPVHVKAVMIDEAQDLTPLQWDICEIAFSECEVVRVAGDDFQALFSYAGASPETLIELAGAYECVKLERSFRLSQAVYRFSHGITSLIKEKIEKDFQPTKELEGFVSEESDRYVLCRKIREDLDKNGATSGRWYLLFRNNCFIQDLTPMLEQFTIPYHTAKGFCIAKRDIDKIKRYYNYRKIGYSTEDAKQSFCEAYGIKDIDEEFTESSLIPGENRFSALEYVKRYGIEELERLATAPPFLLVSTPHRVKGGEAEFSVVFLDCTKMVAENMLLNIDEELRVLYVACTRAKNGLYLVSSQGRYGLDRIVELVKEVVG